MASLPRTSLAYAFLASAFVLSAITVTVILAVMRMFPEEDACAVGLRFNGVAMPVGVAPRDHVSRFAESVEARTVRLRAADVDVASFTLHDLGVRVDVDSTLRRVMAVCRNGDLAFRMDECWKARKGQINVPLAWNVDESPLLMRIAELKELSDEPPEPARYDFASRTAVGGRDGRVLDAYGAVEAVRRVVRDGGDTVNVPWVSVPPVVTTDFVQNLDVSQSVGHFETRFGFVGEQNDRAHNIALAASKLDGLVVMPKQSFSFNQVVGHRTAENGFRKSWEIFKGEMILGVGGGTCQVASTLYASAFLAGLDVVERSHHSRPSGYIVIGLDATVVDGLVDLKMRNPFTFPVVLRTTVDRGKMAVEILGERRPFSVTYRADVVSTHHYGRKIVEMARMAQGRVIRKQRGIPGYTVRRMRTIHGMGGYEREEVTLDVYPPTTEVLLVPVGTDPVRDLPPLPSSVNDSIDVSGSADGVCNEACEERQRQLSIEDGPAARSAAPKPPSRVVIDR